MNEKLLILDASRFSAVCHTSQKRKGERGEPYINHPLEVAYLLASVGKIDDAEILAAAILHDTVEDCGVTLDFLSERFGERISRIVAEVTDDKSLPKDERKRRQVEHAPHLSTEAKQLKLADKISNIRDITSSPPADWSVGRRIDYVDWGVSVVDGLRGVNPDLEAEFDSTVAAARAKIAS
jgi:(p)ppGpp synthase/HD superfamily hydrolase